MRRRQGVRANTLLFLCACGGLGATALAASPLSLHVVTSKSMYAMSEPIELKVELHNTTSTTILTTKGFLAEQAHLRLVFTGPDGKEIRTPPFQPKYEPNALRCIDIRCDGVNVEEIPVMESGEEFVTIIGDARKYYELNQVGHYQVKMATPFETFSSAVAVELTGELVSFLSDPSRRVYDPLESNTVNFEILPASRLSSATIQITVQPQTGSNIFNLTNKTRPTTFRGIDWRLDGMQIRLYRASDVSERFKPMTVQSVARLWSEQTPTSSVLTNSQGKASFENLLQDEYVIISPYSGASAMSFLVATVSADDPGWGSDSIQLDLKLADEV